MTDAKIVDIHSHIVPPDIPGGADRGQKWPSIVGCQHDACAADIVIDGEVFRRVDHRCWDTEVRIADMNSDGIDLQVLSPMPELLGYWLDAKRAEELANIVNQQIKDMINASPGRFLGLGMVTAQVPSKAVQQLHVLAGEGFCGVEIGTHIHGVPLGDESLWPIYEAAQSLNLAIFVHPLHPAGCERMSVSGPLVPAAAFPLEITMAAISLICGGVIDRFPELRFLLSHGGGTLMSVLPRLSKAWDVSEKIREALIEEPLKYARSYWYDSNVYDEDLLAHLVKRVGADRVCVGSDYPFVMRQDRPAHFAEGACPGTASQMSNAAFSLLFGEQNKNNWRIK